MECIEARALKSSFLLKADSQALYNDDVWCLAGINGAAAATTEDFPVDDLLNLDLPEMEFQESGFLQKLDGSDNGSLRLPSSSSSSSSSSLSGADDVNGFSAGEFDVPVEDLENLEWLSQFVDDSSSELSLLFPAGNFSAETPATAANRIEPVLEIEAPVFPFAFPRRSRTGRTRPNSRLWSLLSPLLSAADSSSTTSSSSTLSPFTFLNPAGDRFEKRPVKRQKRSTEAETGRRCTHCQVQKTPQWRTGPLGPKTLCNACGVRFKSGRLFPEYRPACSPTFSLEVHSNSHRKVLEMRRRKEVTVPEAAAAAAAEFIPVAVRSQSV
ncbi:GATA transcription factor 7-like [Andrographis paniculata]|uniref:GATA transcription factor 7-like n=1 Tax=Andrographis paniculata TaxID=175694 RepID=UPI0021E7C0BF|nr:GATA transcription factor 7-like [Andrographis paniculata]XP_051138601.1 GATA transcription factor 7-like [Andrographis paniculata]